MQLSVKFFTMGFLFFILMVLVTRPILGQSPVGVLAQADAVEFVPGELLVKFKDSAGPFVVQNTFAGLGIRPLSVSPYSGVMRVQVPPGQEIVSMAALSAQPQVEYAEPNYIISVARIPFDFNFFSQWGLYNFGQSGGTPGADISAPEAWDITTGNSDVVIAIVDSGVDRSHPDLMDRTWTNGAELHGQPGVDDDGNGYKDDIYGWDFCNTSSSGTCALPGDLDPADEFGHGTQVAGIAAATGNNGTGITGVSWRATLMSVKSQDQYGSGTVSSISNAIDYAVANGANVINLSVATVNAMSKSVCETDLATLHQAIQRAVANGVLVVAASGNSGSISQLSCPASLDEAVAVGATDRFDAHARFNNGASNGGPELDVVAPGKEIYSTKMGNKYGSNSGTSMSTPFVAGLFALLKSYSPALKHNDIRSVIETTADDRGAFGFDNLYGHGRINAHQALEAVVSFRTSPGQTGFLFADNSPNPSITATTEIQLISNDSSTVNWTATISPSVSWLEIGSANSGTISSAGSPMQLTLVATRPVTYTSESTSVIIESEISGQSLGSRTTAVSLQYIEEAELNYLPVIMKN